jgi:hypothetical protein
LSLTHKSLTSCDVPQMQDNDFFNFVSHKNIRGIKIMV